VLERAFGSIVSVGASRQLLLWNCAVGVGEILLYGQPALLDRQVIGKFGIAQSYCQTKRL
jgi:hypothetical protein